MIDFAFGNMDVSFSLIVKTIYSSILQRYCSNDRGEKVFFHVHTALSAPSTSLHNGGIISPAMANALSPPPRPESWADLRFSVDLLYYFP